MGCLCSKRRSSGIEEYPLQLESTEYEMVPRTIQDPQLQHDVLLPSAYSNNTDQSMIYYSQPGMDSSMYIWEPNCYSQPGMNNYTYNQDSNYPQQPNYYTNYSVYTQQANSTVNHQLYEVV